MMFETELAFLEKRSAVIFDALGDGQSQLEIALIGCVEEKPELTPEHMARVCGLRSHRGDDRVIEPELIGMEQSDPDALDAELFADPVEGDVAMAVGESFAGFDYVAI